VRLILLILFLSPAFAQTNEAYVKFLYKLDKFNRELVGCPMEPEVIYKSDCHPAQGVFDAKLWKELQKEAPKAFHSPPGKMLPQNGPKHRE
jgi:hypothetical protein